MTTTKACPKPANRDAPWTDRGPKRTSRRSTKRTITTTSPTPDLTKHPSPQLTLTQDFFRRKCASSSSDADQIIKEDEMT